MKTDITIPLGFEIKTGAPVAVPLRNMAVTGQTQESGKTTTLEALIARSQRRALAFITKRGESGFQNARLIRPYFQERADWQFVESILESAMQQRMKFERAWIVKACRGANTLADVQKNIVRLMETSKRAMDQDMFMLLGEYLKKVVPIIQSLPKSKTLDIRSGLNVMDLTEYPDEMQMLIIASSLRYIYKHEREVVSIIPEAWKMIPQGRNTPVKVEAEKLLREGSVLKNYVWVDSQDMAGVDKLLLRGMPVWIIGVQREANEIKRSLDNIPESVARPKSKDIATLNIGEFYACWGDNIHLTYVQPVWMDAEDAQAIARREKNMVYTAPVTISVAPKAQTTEESDRNPLAEYIEPTGKESDMADLSTLIGQRSDLARRLAEIDDEIERLAAAPVSTQTGGADASAVTTLTLPLAPAPNGDLESVYQFVRQRARRDPELLTLLTTIPELHIVREINPVEANTDSMFGKVIYLLAEGFFTQPKAASDARRELIRRFGIGIKTPTANVALELSKLVQMGYVTNESDGYQAVADMKQHILKN